jgi:A/G-specific adenine glycosylase
VLVSELMLQQTQVATVIPYFERFIARFPTIRALADAPLDDVLRLWQGLGYYSRARNLQLAAKKAIADFRGELPTSVDALLSLPGVGRYTAGAIASLAFGRRSPILDGNVTRVLCRLDRIDNDPRERETQNVLWSRAAEILPRKCVGEFNSALMELGALICTPRTPQCLLCPVRERCAAFAAGLQEKIPAPRKAVKTPQVHRRVFCVRHRGRYLIEQRPPKGRWAGLWQFMTLPHDAAPPDAILNLRPLVNISHALTHRRYEFEALTCETESPDTFITLNRRWVPLADLDNHALPRPHLKIAGLLAEKNN